MPTTSQDASLAGQPLSPRELDVLVLVGNGLDNEAIGKMLFLSRHTVRSHLQRIARKLCTHGRAHAVGVAIATRQLAPRSIIVPVHHTAELQPTASAR
ncbi:helix-turn-helix domain-containing protein [Kitasatospora cineracea]|uniref:helix-turn-helix domain-containing protein n=1 Tax=Kitasatospora cineracea TaxID=88074 RepID=UPI0036BFF28D